MKSGTQMADKVLGNVQLPALNWLISNKRWVTMLGMYFGNLFVSFLSQQLDLFSSNPVLDSWGIKIRVFLVHLWCLVYLWTRHVHHYSVYAHKYESLDASKHSLTDWKALAHNLKMRFAITFFRSNTEPFREVIYNRVVSLSMFDWPSKKYLQEVIVHNSITLWDCIFRRFELPPQLSVYFEASTSGLPVLMSCLRLFQSVCKYDNRILQYHFR